MREIKFRGKRLDNGEWVIGDLIHSRTEAQAVIVDDEGMGRSVIPETIGQYTNLKDKYGKEIYEADIYHLGDKTILSVVEWYDTGFMGRQIGTLGSREGLKHWRDRIVIISNIFDKPRLLKIK